MDYVQNTITDEMGVLREQVRAMDYGEALNHLIFVLRTKAKQYSSLATRRIKEYAEGILNLIDEKIALTVGQEPVVPFVVRDPIYFRYPNINYQAELLNAVGNDYFGEFRRAFQTLGITYPVERLQRV